MPAAYVGAAMAVAQGVNSMANSGSPTASTGPYGSSQAQSNSPQAQSNPFAGLAGGLASSLNPPQAQTSPGAYSPPSNIGEGYNYIPTGQPSIDQLIQSMLSRAANTDYSTGASPASVINSMTGLADANNPYYGDIRAPGGAPMVAQNTLVQGGEQAAGYGSQLSAAGSGYLPQLNALMTAAFDPQSALYDKLRNQTLNQANVQNAATGLGATPYGANMVNEAASNFDINWLQSQLGRMMTGISGLSTGLGAVGNAETTGTNLQNTGGNMIEQAGLVLPNIWNLEQQRYLANQGALSQLASQQQARDLGVLGPAQAYMNSAQGPNALSNNVAATNQIITGNQNANAAAGISQGLNQIMPWIGQGLGGLYKSIFGSSNDGTSTMSNDPSLYPTATMPTGGTVDTSFLEGGSNAGGYF